MPSRRELLATGFGMGAIVLLGSSVTVSAAPETAPVKGATAITQVYGDGQRLTAVALEYVQAIDNAKLSTASFAVAGSTVTRVYATTEPNLAARGTNGRYVIVEFS